MISHFPPQTFEHPAEVLGFVAHALGRGEPCALVVVTAISGGSTRQVGSLAAVTASGVMAGYVSNGCIDADIIHQAQAALADRTVRPLRYGSGSPFIDLQLPCGGSVEILVDPCPDAGTIEAALDLLLARKPVTIAFDHQTGLQPLGSRTGDWRFGLRPTLRLVLAGKGAVLFSMAQQGLAAGFDVDVASPVAEDTERLVALGACCAFDLASPWDAVALRADPWTAVLTLFHDHIWETRILEAALATPAFYIGSLGSVRTHDLRVKALVEHGVAKAAAARIRGPIGLVPSMRSARLLAISALAEIIEADRTRRTNDLAKAVTSQ